MNTLRILIQNKNTKQFFKDQDSWVSDPAAAKNFPTALGAFNFGQINALGEIEILFKLDNQPPKPIINSRQTRVGTSRRSIIESVSA